MGDAKRRGSLEERVAQARSKRTAPTVGVYVSTKKVQGMRLLVEDVTDADDEGFFLVSMLDEASASDPHAAGDELAANDWFDLVDEYGLVYEVQSVG